MYSIKKIEIDRNHKLKSINRGPKKALVISMDYSYWISSKVAVFEYQIQALNSKIEELNSKIEDLTEKVAEKEKNVDKEEKPKKKVRMPGFALVCKKMQEPVMEEVIAFLKRKIEHPQSPLVIDLFRELTQQNLKMWNALTHEERGVWSERAKEIEVEVSDDIDH